MENECASPAYDAVTHFKSMNRVKISIALNFSPHLQSGNTAKSSLSNLRTVCKNSKSSFLGVEWNVLISVKDNVQGKEGHFMPSGNKQDKPV